MPPIITIDFIAWRLETAASEKDGNAILQALRDAIMYGLVAMKPEDKDLVLNLYYSQAKGLWVDVRGESDIAIPVFYDAK